MSEAIAIKITEFYPLLLETLHDARARWCRAKGVEGSLLREPPFPSLPAGFEIEGSLRVARSDYNEVTLFSAHR